MSTINISDFSNFINQGEDPLLFTEEAQDIERQIGSEEFISIVRAVVNKICEIGGASELGNNEVFYISRRASLIDTINEQSDQVAEIITDHKEATRESTPISIVMAYALNELLIRYADQGNIKHIHNSDSMNAYRTVVSINTSRKHKSDSYKNGKSHALRSALTKRKDLIEEQNQAQINTKRTRKLEKAREGLIAQGYLVPHKEGSDTYKIAYIRLRDAKKSSATVLAFRKIIDGKGHSIRRSISEHGFGNAFDAVLDKLLETSQLSGIEKSVLKGEEFKKQALYNS